MIVVEPGNEKAQKAYVAYRASNGVIVISCMLTLIGGLLLYMFLSSLEFLGEAERLLGLALGLSMGLVLTLYGSVVKPRKRYRDMLATKELVVIPDIFRGFTEETDRVRDELLRRFDMEVYTELMELSGTTKNLTPAERSAATARALQRLTARFQSSPPPLA